MKFRKGTIFVAEEKSLLYNYLTLMVKGTQIVMQLEGPGDIEDIMLDILPAE